MWWRKSFCVAVSAQVDPGREGQVVVSTLLGHAGALKLDHVKTEAKP